MATITCSVRDLRQQWQPHKDRLALERDDHPTVVRFHRACSWLEVSETLDSVEQLDQILIQQWIAFNALYGQWNAGLHEPAADRQRWKAFVTQLFALDRGQRIPLMLVEEQSLIRAILANAYLNRYFWEAPTEQSKGRCAKVEYEAQSWYFEKRWLHIAEQTLERIYLLRCQVVHGAATYGSKLNRQALQQGVAFMQSFMPTVLAVWIEHGADIDWGPMCYPPLKAASPPASPIKSRRFPK
jgi:hypothetical protein